MDEPVLQLYSRSELVKKSYEELLEVANTRYLFINEPKKSIMVSLISMLSFNKNKDTLIDMIITHQTRHQSMRQELYTTMDAHSSDYGVWNQYNLPLLLIQKILTYTLCKPWAMDRLGCLVLSKKLFQFISGIYTRYNTLMIMKGINLFKEGKGSVLKSWAGRLTHYNVHCAYRYSTITKLMVGASELSFLYQELLNNKNIWTSIKVLSVFSFGFGFLDPQLDSTTLRFMEEAIKAMKELSTIYIGSLGEVAIPIVLNGLGSLQSIKRIQLTHYNSNLLSSYLLPFQPKSITKLYLGKIRSNVLLQDLITNTPSLIELEFMKENTPIQDLLIPNNNVCKLKTNYPPIDLPMLYSGITNLTLECEELKDLDVLQDGPIGRMFGNKQIPLESLYLDNVRFHHIHNESTVQPNLTHIIKNTIQPIINIINGIQYISVNVQIEKSGDLDDYGNLLSRDISSISPIQICNIKCKIGRSRIYKVTFKVK